MSYETEIKIHRIFALYAIVLGVYHGVRGMEEGTWAADFRNVTGYILTAMVIVFMVLGILFKFVKGFYTFFIGTHRTLLLVVFIVAILHGASLVTIIGGIAWGFDILMRLIIMRNNRKKLGEGHYEVLEETYLKISFSKSKKFVFMPG